MLDTDMSRPFQVYFPMWMRSMWVHADFRLPQPKHSKEDDMTMLTTQEQQEIDKRPERRCPSARPGSLASEERPGHADGAGF